MTKSERDYASGRRALATRIARELLPDLGTLTEARIFKLAIERAEAVTALRTLCAELGCNDWPDELSLADVIEKHLGRAVRNK